MLKFKNYSVNFEESGFFSIFIKDVMVCRLPVNSAVDRLEDLRYRPGGSIPLENQFTADVDNDGVTFSLEEIDGKTVAVYTATSNLWDKKTYSITATENGIAYRIAVKGNGKVKRIRYFNKQGFTNEYEFAGYRILAASHYKREECLRNIFETSQLSFDYYAPCPFVYPFYTEGLDGWFGFGVFAEKGEHNFDRLIYNRFFSMELPLDGRIIVSGEKELPGMWGGYGKDDYAVLTAYSDFYFDEGIAKRHSDYSLDPKWWKGPIFCGWGEQQKLGRVAKKPATLYASQKDYENMVNTLHSKGVNPKIIIIDAKWQKGMGTPEVDTEKWPDMREFVDKMHSEGIKVLLWIKSWDAEGLPKDECIDNLCNPVAADPTNPKFRERIKNNIRTLFSSEEGCMDCDGFKIDFINCTPKGEYVRAYDGKSYGVELVRAWLELVYTSAKAVKSDCLINISSAHPYTADVADQIRLHDYQGGMRSSVEVMTCRAEIARAVYGNITCDTDSGGTVSDRDFRRYTQAQPTIGVPDLYYVTSSFGTPMDDGDYEIIRNTWNKYIKENDL